MEFMWVFFRQKAAYEMGISDWSSDVGASGLAVVLKTKGKPAIGLAGRDAEQIAAFLKSIQQFGNAAIKRLIHLPLSAQSVKGALVAFGHLVVPVRLGFGERSEERRVGNECVRTCRSRWWPYH